MMPLIRRRASTLVRYLSNDREVNGRRRLRIRGDSLFNLRDELGKLLHQIAHVARAGLKDRSARSAPCAPEAISGGSALITCDYLRAQKSASSFAMVRVRDVGATWDWWSPIATQDLA